MQCSRFRPSRWNKLLLMKIATLNANSLRSRKDIVLDWLDTNEPDVLCIQETKVQDVDFPVEAFAASGYEFVFRGQKKYNGVALFSRGEIEDVSFGLDDEPKDESRMVKAVVNGVSIVNTYVPQGRSPDSDMFGYKLEWFDRLRGYFDKHFSPEDAVVWLGDLNVAPLAKDVHDPKRLLGSVCFCDEVSNALAEVMEWGFTDIFRKYCDEAGQYTFWDYRVPNGFRRNIGWRLDHIMATDAMARKSLGCWIDKEPRGYEKPSDHTFLIAEFDV